MAPTKIIKAEPAPRGGGVVSYWVRVLLGAHHDFCKSPDDMQQVSTMAGMCQPDNRILVKMHIDCPHH